MNQQEMFGKGLWVGKENVDPLEFAILYGSFKLDEFKEVKIRVVGLGYFRLTVNGVCLINEGYLPLSSDYHKREDTPKGEILTGHRIYVSEFDLTELAHSGENTLEINFGGGWYTWDYNYFGLPKAIYSVLADGEQIAYSSEKDLLGKSYVSDYKFRFYPHEEHDLTLDLKSDLQNAQVVEQIDTRYMFTNCPVDTRIRELTFKKVCDTENGTVYDCGTNISGYPEIKVTAKRGEKVVVKMAEELLPDGNLDPYYKHSQEFIVISDGTERIQHAEFQWYGFRYIEIVGDAEPVCAAVVHPDIKITSSFKCDNETLNWIYKTFVDTMLFNIHNGHPSDCPHLEKLGYTGDGQLTCHAVMSTLDIKETYRKWLEDISDCQDTLSGNVQYTAPYHLAGGGPGGWGSAIVEVPWQFYRHYGEKEIIAKYYPQMKKYIGYLDAHSTANLVTSGQEGLWCLGEWCAPAVHSNYHGKQKNAQVIIAPPFVNTYFKVKSLLTMIKIATIIGEEQDIPEFEKKIEDSKAAIKLFFHDPFFDNYFNNLHGANAFAVDVDMGGKLYDNLVEYYSKNGFLDTGIFGTDLVPKVLFKGGNGQLAVDLLTSDHEVSFEHWRKQGATTFREYWQDEQNRSHSHPMFGSPVAYFFEYLLGIKQKEFGAGYTDLIIEPTFVSQINNLSGHMDLPKGRVEVSYQKTEQEIKMSVTIPEGVKAVFIYSDLAKELPAGKNEFTITL